MIHSITLRDDVTLPGTQKLGRYIGVQHGVTFAQDALGVVITNGGCSKLIPWSNILCVDVLSKPEPKKRGQGVAKTEDE